MGNFDFGEDDEVLNDLHYEFSIGYEDENPTKKMHNRPVFSYKYLCLDGTYGFKHNEFLHKEWRKYFDLVKEFSNCSLEDLVESQNNNLHFRLQHSYNQEHAELEKLIGYSLKKDELPILGHFALYTTPADPKNLVKKIKSPRIFFLLGKNSVLHILFFDPFHEIHKKK